LKFFRRADTKIPVIATEIHPVPPPEDRYNGKLKVMVAPLDPIIMLAKLIAEEERIHDKIRDTQAALTLVKKKISESLLQSYSSQGPKVHMPEDLMNEEQSYERLLQALQDMKNEIAKQIRPVEEQIIHANREHIRQSFTQESQRLGQCLDEIDNNILACRKAMEEYERIRNGLNGLNEKLTQVGSPVLQIPDSLPSHDLGEIVKARVEHLRSEGKL
jgi:primosomal protein N''